MGFRSRLGRTLLILLLLTLAPGCLSYQLVGGVEGGKVAFPSDRLVVGKTTLGEALALLGAPDTVDRATGLDLLIYERAVVRGNRLSLGIPIVDVWRVGFDLSAYGGLVRYDRLVLFFSPEGILLGTAFEEGSKHPYLRVMRSNS